MPISSKDGHGLGPCLVLQSCKFRPHQGEDRLQIVWIFMLNNYDTKPYESIFLLNILVLGGYQMANLLWFLCAAWVKDRF